MFVRREATPSHRGACYAKENSGTCGETQKRGVLAREKTKRERERKGIDREGKRREEFEDKIVERFFEILRESSIDFDVDISRFETKSKREAAKRCAL